MITEGKKVRVRLSVDKEALNSQCPDSSETILVKQRVKLLEKIESIAALPSLADEATTPPASPADMSPSDSGQFSGIENNFFRLNITGKLSPLYCERLLAFSSPHSLAVYKIGEEVGMAFILTERPPGMALSEYARQGKKLSVENVLQVFTQVAEALTAAHETGLFHGDLNAESIFVTEGEGGHLYVKVAGLGVKQLSEDLSISTRWQDLQALGCLLYECLSGEKPAAVGDAQITLPDLPPSPFANLTNCSALVKARHSALIKAQLQYFVSSLLRAGEACDVQAAFAVKRLVELEQNYSRPTTIFLFTAWLAQMGRKLTREQELAVVACSLIAAAVFIVVQSTDGLVKRQQFLTLVASAQGAQLNLSQNFVTRWRQAFEFARKAGYSKRTQANVLVRVANAEDVGINNCYDFSGPCYPGLDNYLRALSLYEQVPGSQQQREVILRSILGLVEQDAANPGNSDSTIPTEDEFRDVIDASKLQNDSLLQKLDDWVNSGRDPAHYQSLIDKIGHYWLNPAHREAMPLSTAEQLAALSTNPAMCIDLNHALYGVMIKAGINPDSQTERLKLASIADERGDKVTALLHMKAALALDESSCELRTKYTGLLANYFTSQDGRQKLASVNGLIAARKMLQLHLRALGPDSRLVRDDWMRISKMQSACGQSADCEKTLLAATGVNSAKAAMDVLLREYKAADAERLLTCVQRQGRLKETVELALMILDVGETKIARYPEWVRPVNTARSALINDAIARNDQMEAQRQLSLWDAERARAVSSGYTGTYNSQELIDYDLLFPLY